MIDEKLLENYEDAQMALLMDAYAKAEGEALSAYLNDKVFAGQTGTTLAPDAKDVAGFDAFVENYKACYAAEHGAVDNWK